MEDEARQKLMNYAYFYLNIRPRTVKELRDYLLKKAKKFNFKPDIIQAIVDRLSELKLLDDREFVRWYVEGKFASSRKSLFLLRQELARVGVPKGLIDEYFENQTIDELSAARAALNPKWKRFGQISDQKTRFNKAASHLARKGFSYDIIKKTIAEYEEDE
jgi:regulatory protein